MPNFVEIDHLPRDSYDLIDFLDTAHPHECIRIGETIEQAHRTAGIRELVDHLLILKVQDIENAALEATGGGKTLDDHKVL